MNQSTELRLKTISCGRSLSFLQKVFLLPIRLSSGKYPGPMLVGSYKRKMFGKYYAEFLHGAMRGQKHWTAGETELFASFTALQLKCHD